MKIAGLMCVRDEEVCCGLTIDTVKDWVDEIILVDHSSTDKTVDIITNKCNDYKIPLQTFTIDAAKTLVDLRAKAITEAMKSKPDWFFIIDGDMVFNTIGVDVRELVRNPFVEQYWFSTLNIYGDKEHFDGMNIPHLWLFKNVKSIYATASYHCPDHRKATSVPFLGWNLGGLKSVERLFWRYQLWYSRAWNRGHDTNINVDEFLKEYFDGPPSPEYVREFMLNRIRVRAKDITTTAHRTDFTNPDDNFGMRAVDFEHRYLTYPAPMRKWECPYKLIVENGEIIGRDPDILNVPVKRDDEILQLTEPVLEEFRAYNSAPFTARDIITVRAG